jgi:hypothetical protein
LALALAVSAAVYANAGQTDDLDIKTAPRWQAPNPMPADPLLPEELVERHYWASASRVVFGQIYSMQLECLPYAGQAATPIYDQCLLARHHSCLSAALCTTVEAEVMTMFLEHYGGSARVASVAGAADCAREVEEGVAEMGPGVRTTLSTTCHARSITDAAIAARWAARLRAGL